MEETEEQNVARYATFAKSAIWHYVDLQCSTAHRTLCGILLPWSESRNHYPSGWPLPYLHTTEPLGRPCYTCQTFLPYVDRVDEIEQARRDAWERTGSQLGCLHGEDHFCYWYWTSKLQRYLCRRCYPQLVAQYIVFRPDGVGLKRSNAS